MSLRDRVAAFEDVRELTIEVPAWDNEPVLFRGMTLAALQEIQGLNLPDATSGTDIMEAIKLVQATACDPESKELAFAGPEGYKLLASKSYEAIMFMVVNGTNKVLGIDQENEAGKGSSSVVTESQTTEG